MSDGEDETGFAGVGVEPSAPACGSGTQVGLRLHGTGVNGLRLHGTGVTDEMAIEAGEQMIRLLEEIERAKFGTNHVKWDLVGIRYICDGCERERPSAELPPDWICAGGDDLCFACQCGRLGVPAVLDGGEA